MSVMDACQVSVNRFSTDTEAELNLVVNASKEVGAFAVREAGV